MTTLLMALGTLAMVSFAVSALISLIWWLTGRGLRRIAPAAESRLLLLFVLLPMTVAGFSQWVYWSGEGAESEGHGSYRAGAETPSPTTASLAGLQRVSLLRVEGRGEHNRERREGGEHSREWRSGGEHGGESTPWRAESGETSFADFPSAMLLLFAGFGSALVARFALILSRSLRAIRTSKATAAALRDAANPGADGIWVIPGDKPEAFVLGLTRPQLFASQGLLSMPDKIVQAVLAHEHGHIRRRDPLRHLLVLMASTFHLPGIAEQLQKRTQQVQELAADADAAQSLGDATSVAEALVRCARFQRHQDAPHVAFGGGELEERVRTLLSGQRSLDQPQRWLIGLLAVVAAYATSLLTEPAHHVIESLFTLSF